MLTANVVSRMKMPMTTTMTMMMMMMMMMMMSVMNSTRSHSKCAERLDLADLRKSIFDSAQSYITTAGAWAFELSRTMIVPWQRPVAQRQLG